MPWAPSLVSKMFRLNRWRRILRRFFPGQEPPQHCIQLTNCRMHYRRAFRSPGTRDATRYSGARQGEICGRMRPHSPGYLVIFRSRKRCAIRSCFVDTLAGFKAPSCFSKATLLQRRSAFLGRVRPSGELNHAASVPAAYASSRALPHAHARLASGRWLASAGRGSNPLDSDEGFLSATSDLLLSQAYPGATECKTGRLPSAVIGGRRFISAEAIADLIERSTTTESPSQAAVRRSKSPRQITLPSARIGRGQS